MATIFSKLGKLGPGWVTLWLGIGIPLLVLVFGYIFESIYYGMFGVPIIEHVSKTYLILSPFRHPWTFIWAVLFTFVFLVYFHILLGLKSKKHAIPLSLMLVILLVGAYSYISRNAKEHAEFLRPIIIPSANSKSASHTFLLIGDIGQELVICDPKSGSVTIIENPGSIGIPDERVKKVNAMHCWH